MSAGGAGSFAAVPAESSRALVVGVIDPALDGDAAGSAAEALVRAGADLVEVADPAVADRLRAADLPVVGPGGPGVAAARLTPGAASPLAADAASPAAAASPLTPGTATAPLADDAAALAVAVVLGAPAVRTHDVRAARRVVDVLAAIADAARTGAPPSASGSPAAGSTPGTGPAERAAP